jgi:hypothetical protein
MNPHNSVTTAIRNGELIKHNECFRCGLETDKLEAHHNDYNKPLEVEWLCKNKAIIKEVI